MYKLWSGSCNFFFYYCINIRGNRQAAYCPSYWDANQFLLLAASDLNFTELFWFSLVSILCFLKYVDRIQVLKYIELV